MKRMTFKQTNFSNKVNIRCIHTAFHDSLFILCCFLYHIKVTSLRDSNLLQWTETFKKFDIGGGLSCSHFWVEGLFTTLFLLLHSLLRNRKTLRTLESGHYPIRKWSLSVLYYWHNLILELQRINTKLFCQSGCCCGSERPPTNQQHQPDLVRSSDGPIFGHHWRNHDSHAYFVKKSKHLSFATFFCFILWSAQWW